MSANTKSLLSYALIDLCNENSSRRITVTQLLQASGVSRPVFYNNFRDLQDLILWTYIYRIELPRSERIWTPKILSFDEYTEAMAGLLRRMQQNLPFMQFAFKDNSQNCLRVSGAKWIIDAEKKWICNEYQLDAISPEMDYCIRVLTRGFFDYVSEWTAGGAKNPSPEELAGYIVGLRYRAYRDLLPEKE